MQKISLKKYLLPLIASVQIISAQTYTLDELIIESLQNSPDVAISEMQYNASEKRYNAAFANYLPSIDMLGSAGLIHQDETLTTPKSIDDTLLLGKLSLKQLVYDFGKTGGSVDSNKYQVQAAQMQNLQKISDKKRDVKQAYYNVLKAKALIDVQKESVKLNAAQLYRARKYFDAGIRTKIDVSDAKVRLIQAKLKLKKAQYDLKLAYTELDKVVGFEDLEKQYDVLTQALDLAHLYGSLSLYPLGLKDAILYAYEHRPEVQSTLAQLQARRSEIHTASAEYFPALYLNASYTYQHLDEYTEYLPQKQWDATLNLNWNFYKGGATQANKEEKKIQASISESELLNTKLQIKKNTTDAYLTLNRSRDTVELDQSLLEVSMEKFTQASKRYEHGLSDYIELQEARQGYIDSKAILIIDYYNYYIAFANLDNAIGK